MNENRLPDYLTHIRTSASEACNFIEGLMEQDFVSDRRTQQAVIMNLIIVGEAATKIMTHYPDFVAANSQVPWRNMRGMRNRITHGYFDIDLKLVWKTVETALPDLLRHLPKA